MAFLAILTARGPILPIVWAIAKDFAKQSSPFSEISFKIPRCRASKAVSLFEVKISSFALAIPMILDNFCVPPAL